MIVDVHTHVFPDEIALEVVPKMAAGAGIKESIDGRLSSLVESMDEAGIEMSWLQPVATKPKQVNSINRWVESGRSERVVAFGSFHPDCENLPGLIRDLSSRGFPGVKMHPEYHTIEPDDERLFAMYEAMIEERMIVLFHAGVDIEIPTLNSTPEHFARLIDRFPDLAMILAHLGGFRQWEEVARVLIGRDVYLDTSYVLGHLPDEDFVTMVRAHGADRVLFGTDSPWADQKGELEHLRSLPFSEKELDNICGENAARLLHHRLPPSRTEG